MTKTSTRGGLLTRALSCGCAVALAASLAPAAGVAWAANAVDSLAAPAAGPVYVNVGTLDSDGTFDVFSSASVATTALSDDFQDNAVVYYDGGEWNVAATNTYVTLPNILKAAGLDQYWTSDAKLAYDGSSAAADVNTNTDFSSFKTYASYQGGYYFPETKADSDTAKMTDPAKTEVETGLAFNLYTSAIGGSIYTDPSDDAQSSSSDTAKGTVDLMKAAIANLFMPVSGANTPAITVMNGVSVKDYQDKWNCIKTKVLSSAAVASINIAVPEAVKVDRIYGTEWADTMVEALDATFTGGAATGTNIVLTTAETFQDALAASGLAGALKCPVVMTDGDSLTKQAADYMQKYLDVSAAANIYVIGGEVAIKPVVVDAIKRLDAFYGKQETGLNIERISGDEAWDTSLKIREKIAGFTDASYNLAGKGDIVIACSGGFEDAMSIAPFAYATGTPVVLANSANVLSDDAVKALVGNGAANALDADGSCVNIIGGTAVVSDQVKVQLAAVKKVYRTFGDSAYDTSNEVAKLLYEESDRFETSDTTYKSGTSPFKDATVSCFATGENYLDALASAAYCGTAAANPGGPGKTSVLLLVSNSDNTTVDGFLTAKAAINNGGTGITSATIFGGEGVLGKAVQMDINQTLTKADN